MDQLRLVTPRFMGFVRWMQQEVGFGLEGDSYEGTQLYHKRLELWLPIGPINHPSTRQH